ncbi:hypothetical protein QNA27_18755 [Pantoea eucalypti]|uniref:hypothetical protein n=1 Tax=Pantoea eucalypti TaxID=470933 RepID=UPI0024BB3223|nr:hypothetical protein [Pantoea eucalypti]MDJ0475702.1 hypothetical protein [Pantoea eucalypti]
MVDEVNVSKSHLMRAFIVENGKSDAETDWMDEMERELRETEKKWPVTGINWKP